MYKSNIFEREDTDDMDYDVNTIEGGLRQLLIQYAEDIRTSFYCSCGVTKEDYLNKIYSAEDISDIVIKTYTDSLSEPNLSLKQKISNLTKPTSDCVLSGGDGFRKSISSEQNKLLENCRFMHELCFAICANFNSEVKANNLNKGIEHLYQALHGINGTALRMFNEVICLCENGFPEAAYARSRTIFEYNALAVFLIEDTDDTAKAFIQSGFENIKSEKDHYKWALNSERFKDKQAEDISISTFINNYNNHINTRVTDISMSNTKFRKPYDNKSFFVHASAKGVFGRFNDKPQDFSILDVDRRFVGIELALIDSANSITIILSKFLSCVCCESGIVGLNALKCATEFIVNMPVELSLGKGVNK